MGPHWVEKLNIHHRYCAVPSYQFHQISVSIETNKSDYIYTVCIQNWYASTHRGLKTGATFQFQL
jgi:fatty acid desaturase